MRTALRLTAAVLLGACLHAQPQPVGSMSDLMVKIVYPASDAIFYITTRTPTTESQWTELQGKALAVAEAANLLMMPGRARDQDRWMADAKLMLDAGRAAYVAARAKDVPALEALNDQLYTSCTSCHQHYRAGYGRGVRGPGGSGESGTSGGSGGADGASLGSSTSGRSGRSGGADAVVTSARSANAGTVAAQPPPSIEGRWKLLAAEDLRGDGTVARLPWGAHPAGSIVVDRGSCYLQIMSTDVPSFAAGTAAPGDQMKATLLSSYIAYSGPCTIDETAGSVTLKVEAAWRPDYVGTEQKRFFRFEGGKLLFGPAPNSIRSGNEQLTRRLTLQRIAER